MYVFFTSPSVGGIVLSMSVLTLRAQIFAVESGLDFCKLPRAYCRIRLRSVHISAI